MRSVRAAVIVSLAMVAVLLPVGQVGAVPAAPAITGSPEATIGSNRAAFTFHTAGADSYQCRVFTAGTAEGSRPAYSNCTGATQGYHQADGLADGDWTFEVRAVDAGEQGPSTAFDWSVSSGAVVQWISEPDGSYNGRYVTATFSAAGATSFQCRVYRTDPVPATLPSFSGCGSGLQGYWVSSQLADGAYRLEVRANSAAGLGPIASATFSVGDVLTVSWVSRPEGAYTSRYLAATFLASGATSYQCRVYRTDPVPATLGTAARFGDI